MRDPKYCYFMFSDISYNYGTLQIQIILLLRTEVIPHYQEHNIFHQAKRNCENTT